MPSGPVCCTCVVSMQTARANVASVGVALRSGCNGELVGVEGETEREVWGEGEREAREGARGRNEEDVGEEKWEGGRRERDGGQRGEGKRASLRAQVWRTVMEGAGKPGQGIPCYLCTTKEALGHSLLLLLLLNVQKTDLSHLNYFKVYNSVA